MESVNLRFSMDGRFSMYLQWAFNGFSHIIFIFRNLLRAFYKKMLPAVVGNTIAHNDTKHFA